MGLVRSQSGFSLVELAIAVVGIGLLLGLVVKGGEMIDNARISSTAMQIKSMEVAIDAFRSEFKAWPGDLNNATAVIAGCAAAPTCRNSATPNGAITPWGGTINPAANMGVIAGGGIANETYQAWQHLALSGYGAGIPQGPLGQGFGITTPSASIGGGFEIFYDSQVTGGGVTPPPAGHYFRLSSVLSNAALGGAQGIDGFVAFGIDLKLDDNSITTGDIVSTGVGAGCNANAIGNCLLFSRIPD